MTGLFMWCVSLEANVDGINERKSIACPIFAEL